MWLLCVHSQQVLSLIGYFRGQKPTNELKSEIRVISNEIKSVSILEIACLLTIIVVGSVVAVYFIAKTFALIKNNRGPSSEQEKTKLNVKLKWALTLHEQEHERKLRHISVY